MRLPNRLPQLRGERTITDIANATGIARPYLSQIERGLLMPRDEWLPALENAYGESVATWYETWLIHGDGGRMLIKIEDGD